MERWHILQTKPSKEQQVAVLIHQRGLRVYLPLLWGNPVNPRSARRLPYFPRYLFTRFDLQCIEPDILRWTPGLTGLVEFGREPATAYDSFVSELQQRLSRIRVVGEMAFEGARRAELVQIVEGPFAGYEGIFSVSLSGPDRARILLACIQREQCRLSTRTPLHDVPPGR